MLSQVPLAMMRVKLAVAELWLALALSATVGGARMGEVLLMAAVASVLLSALLFQPVLASALQRISVLASVCYRWRC